MIKWWKECVGQGQGKKNICIYLYTHAQKEPFYLTRSLLLVWLVYQKSHWKHKILNMYTYMHFMYNISYVFMCKYLKISICYTSLYFQTFFKEHLWVHSKIERKVQRFPIYCLPTPEQPSLSTFFTRVYTNLDRTQDISYEYEQWLALRGDFHVMSCTCKYRVLRTVKKTIQDSV